MCITIVCLSVRGDNPRALASGLSYVKVDKHSITIFYHLHQCRPCISRDHRAKVGMGGISKVKHFSLEKGSLNMV